MFVYKITNQINGKSYIGVTTTSIQKRWREHRCVANKNNPRPLYRAIRKYGDEAFCVSEISRADSVEELKKQERYFIQTLNTYYLNNRGYNLTDGGDGIHFVNRARGELAGSAVLTQDIVKLCRTPSLKHVNNADMVEKILCEYGVKINIDTLKCARNGKTWKHLNDQYPPINAKKGSRSAPLSPQRLKEATETLGKHRREAIRKAVEATKGKPSKNAKMNYDQILDIYYGKDSLMQTAKKYGISKKMVLLIRHQKAYTYWTKELSRG